MRAHGWYCRATLRMAVAGAAAAATTMSAPVLAAAPETKTIIAFEWTGFEGLFPAEKDAGLNRALGLIPDRLRELRLQVPEMQGMPQDMLDLGMTLMSRPMRFAVTSAPAPGFDGLGATLSMHLGDEGLARELDQHMLMFGSMSGMPEPGESQRFSEMHMVPVPGAGAVNFGPRQAGDGWRYEVLVGHVEDPDRSFDDLPGMGDGEVVARGTLDLAAASPFVNMMLPMVEAMMPPGTVDSLRNQGLIGDQALAFDYVEGYVGDAGVSRMVSKRFKRYAEAMGYATTPLSARDLAMVPSDAYAAQIRKVNFSTYVEQLDQMLPLISQGQMNLEMLDEMMAEQVGTSMTALMESFGETIIAYISDQTGGNTIMSGVVVMEMKDTQPMRRVMDRGANMVNQLIAMEMERENVPGRVKFQSRTIEGVEYLQLRFPGLPVPIEPTMAVTDKWMFLGMSPQACYGAVQQSRARGGAGLADNEAFKNFLWEVPERPTGITFIDSGRTMSDGYGTVCMLCSALANFVRSEDGSRDPGMVAPTLSALRQGARPMISVTFFDGEDLVTETRTDMSMLVNAAGVLGVGDLMPVIAGGFIGGGMVAQMNEQMHGNEWAEEWDDEGWGNEEWDDEGWENEEMEDDDDAY